MTIWVVRNALVVLSGISCVLSAPNSLSAQELATARASITARSFWNGQDGAACMADVLRARAPQFVYRTGTFQDFDAVFPVAFNARLARLYVISASEYVLRGAAYPFAGLEPALSGEHRYYFDLGTKEVLPRFVLDVVLAVRGDWEQTCRAFQAPLFSVGVCQCSLRPEDFLLKGELDLQTLLPLLTPAPLTPVDIR